MKIDLDIIKVIYEYSVKFYNKEISLKNALDELYRKGYNKNSSMDYLYNYRNLVEGKRYTRTMSVIAIKYYLDKIIETKGISILENALFSISLHIDYYKKTSKSNVITLNNILNEYQEKYNIKPDKYFGEEETSSETLTEGNVKTIRVNIYERNPIARKKCIDHYGAKCIICDFDFEKEYGGIGKGFIHVHHLSKISGIKKKYEVDYKKDLVPICPNCHAMIHKKEPPYTIDELKEIKNKKKNN